jgi:hypothetical protein
MTMLDDVDDEDEEDVSLMVTLSAPFSVTHTGAPRLKPRRSSSRASNSLTTGHQPIDI